MKTKIVDKEARIALQIKKHLNKAMKLNKTASRHQDVSKLHHRAAKMYKVAVATQKKLKNCSKANKIVIKACESAKETRKHRHTGKTRFSDPKLNAIINLASMAVKKIENVKKAPAVKKKTYNCACGVCPGEPLNGIHCMAILSCSEKSFNKMCAYRLRAKNQSKISTVKPKAKK